MTVANPHNLSPYAENPHGVALAFTQGRFAAREADGGACPYDAADQPDETGAWQRGFRVGRQFDG